MDAAPSVSASEGQLGLKAPKPVDRRMLLRLGLPVGALVVGLLAGMGIVAANSDPTSSQPYKNLAARLSSAQASATQAQTSARDAIAAAHSAVEAGNQALAASQSAVQASAASLSSAQAAIDATSITDGSWTVGRDVRPGTYRTSQPVGGGVANSCYWAISRSGTNGSDIIENDNVDGGFPTVTLSVGQDFKSQACGTWVKQ